MLAVKTFTFNPVQENTYLLYNEQGSSCIIDPGCYFPEERDLLKSEIEKAGLRPSLLLLTHCHLDHVFGVQFVHDNWGLIPHLHRLEQPVLERASEDGVAWGLPFDGYQGETRHLDPADQVLIGTDKLTMRFTPGHSPGSISFYYEPGSFIIGGDVLFRDSIGRTDLPGGDYGVLENSIREQFYTLPEATVVYPGHGPATRIAWEKKNNPFVQED